MLLASPSQHNAPKSSQSPAKAQVLGLRVSCACIPTQQPFPFVLTAQVPSVLLSETMSWSHRCVLIVVQWSQKLIRTAIALVFTAGNLLLSVLVPAYDRSSHYLAVMTWIVVCYHGWL